MLCLTVLFSYFCHYNHVYYDSSQSDKDSKEDIQKVFQLFDDSSKGSISLDNLKRVARELGEDMSEEELREMIERADLDGDGVISMDEFFNIMTKKTFQ